MIPRTLRGYAVVIDQETNLATAIEGLSVPLEAQDKCGRIGV
jgi:hypothetical protein